MIIKILKYIFKFFIAFIIFNIFNFYSLQAQQFKTHFSEGLVSAKVASDSIHVQLNNIRNLAIIQKDSSLLVKSLISLSAYERFRLNYNGAFNNAGEALFIAEESDDNLLKAKANEEMGVLTYLYKQDQESGNYFATAHHLYKTLYSQDKLNPLDLFQSHYNMVMQYQRISDIKNLNKHIKICDSISSKNKVPPIYNIYLKEKKSSIAEWNGDYKEAISLLDEITNILENIHPDSSIQEFHKQFLLIVYGRLATIYLILEQDDLAKNHFEKLTKIEGVQGETMFYRSFLYSNYAALLNRQGLYAKAYDYEQKSNAIGNAYLNPRNERNKGFLTIKNRYKDELLKKNELLNRKNLELAKKQEDILRFRILLALIVLILVVVGFMVRSRIRSLKFQKQTRDSNELLTIKNKELTANTLQLIEKEEVIKKLSHYIKESHPDKRSISFLKSIERNSTSLWDAFNKRFTEQNIGFYERLQKKAPNLSSSDLKLCALIKLNFTGKEMAYLLGISLGSVHVARHRLRKKLSLTRDLNLTHYINSI